MVLVTCTRLKKFQGYDQSNLIMHVFDTLNLRGGGFQGFCLKSGDFCQLVHGFDLSR